MISFLPDSRIFKLSTRGADYAFRADDSGFLLHLHYGARVSDDAALAAYAACGGRPSFQPNPACCTHISLDTARQEFAGFNTGDYRVPGIILRWGADGSRAVDPRYVSHRVFAGAPDLPELPAAFTGADNGVETLEVTLADAAHPQLLIHLAYTVFPASDVIARAVRVENRDDAPVTLERIMSFGIDFPRDGFDLLELPGAWARERHAERFPTRHGVHTLRSVRGATGHSMNSAFALLDPTATESAGDAYGFVLCYSGCFQADVEVTPFGCTRATAGIAPDGFSWTLRPGESFQSPQAFLSFSADGLGGLSRNFHDFLRGHVIDPRWVHAPRPALINNWEATYFDFDAEKILAIAREAAARGIEALVLDDGWFGHRDDDRTSLGDWFENAAKIGDMAALSAGVHALGLKFGLWFEPEMVSVDSELYRAHPDWPLRIPGRDTSFGRNQLVLDFSRSEVVEGVAKTVIDLVRRAKIDYVKYDMNRNHTEAFSAALPADRQGEVEHRFILGVYRFHRLLLEALPDVLIEGCSGGGGRYDAGMLRYTPQIWCSDDTDATERVRIQMGTSVFYPCSAMGAHVSVCPNHQTGRISPFESRANVALSGTFGYELDITKLSEDDRKAIPGQVEAFHEQNPVVARGDLFRLTPSWGAPRISAWMFVEKDKSKAILTVFCSRNVPNAPDVQLRLQGLDPAAKYDLGTERFGARVLHGDTLMNAGLLLTDYMGDAASIRIVLKRL